MYLFVLLYIYKKFTTTPEKKLIFFGVVVLIFLPIALIYLPSNREEALLRRDFYTSYAVIISMGPALYMENKLVNFKTNAVSIKWRLHRYVIALAFILGTFFGLHTLWPNKIIVLDMIRYFSLLIVGIGIFPFIFRNTRLFKAKEQSN